MSGESLIVEYFRYHKQYAEQFGKDNTVILMQVGSFYEVYATLTEGPDLDKLEELTDVIVTKRNASRSEINLKNPLMWGFPVISGTKYIDMLVDNGYHLVVVDQVAYYPNTKRKVVAVYSPGTYIDTVLKASSNFIECLFVEELQQKNGQYIVAIGMSALDCSTGKVCVHESYSSIDDEKLGLDEAIRFTNGLNPKELVIYTNTLQKLSQEKLVDYLDLDKKLHQFKQIKQELCKIPFQKKLLENIYFNSRTMVNIFETLEIDQTIYAKNSLISLLVYVSDHQSNLIKDIAEPSFYINSQHLVLGNDAINQLNIVKTNNPTKKTKYNNLIDIINKASTNMGKRFVDMRVVSPLVDPNELQKIYSKVEKLLKDDRYQKIDGYLKNIHDIERMYRNIALASLHPMHLVELIESCKQIYLLLEYTKEINEPALFDKLSLDSLQKQLGLLNTKLDGIIKIDSAKIYRINDIRENIFKEGYSKELDKLEQQIGLGHDTVQKLLDKLDKMIVDSAKNNKIILKHNKREGYYFQTTKKRYASLRKNLDKNETIDIDKVKLRVKDLVVDDTTKVVKISAPFLKGHTDDIDELTRKITDKSYEIYKELLSSLNSEFGDTIKQTIKLITEIDYLTTIAKVAKQHNYVKPVIKHDTTKSMVKATDLRHPIVEQIIEHEYVPHTIDLGDKLKGMLIYGLNSSGKSVLMKAIGISLIMAQAGFFVPAKEFVYFPYKAIYTRITGNDNIFRGLSSFALEMVELNAILKRATSDTLVIGDEVCRGTEHISGNAIVAASLIRLSDLGSTFVFATHLHELADLDEIKEKENIRAFHLSVEIDPDTDNLVYDRQLKNGSGEQIYGITVAKYIIRDVDLINKSLEIKNKLLNKNIAEYKKSRYNNSVLIDKCSVCGKYNSLDNRDPLETHHINKQSDCVDGFVKAKPHIKKDAIANLMALCRECHEAIHKNKINITGYKMTTKGTKLTVK